MRWRLFRYRLPLKRPLTTGADAPIRRGLIVELTDSGETGYGEAAPLPGLHTETLAQVEAALIATLRDGTPAPPVARHAIECARLRGRAAHTGTVSVNALITGPDPVESAAAAVAAGHRALKLKVGRQPLAEDLRTVHALRARFPGVALRLDANRAWDFEPAVAFCQQVPGIAYIEEPLRDPDRLTDLHRQTGVPLALDESLAEDRPVPEGVAAVVIKPSVLSLSGAQAWIKRAQSIGAAAVISGAFESGIARRAHLALAAGLGETISGLSTAGWLAEDLLDPPLRPERGRFTLPVTGRIRLDRLEEVTG